MSEPAPSTRAQARRRRRNRRWTIAGAAVVVLVLAIGGFVAFSGGDGSSAKRAEPRSAAPPSVATTAPPFALRAAATNGSDITVYPSPDASAAPLETLTQLTAYKLPRTLLAFGEDNGWLHVYLPTRPNNSTGWIMASNVNLSQPLQYSVKIDLAAHHLWLMQNGTAIFDSEVAIGSPQYPTPTGTFYTTDPIDLHDNPNAGYGVFAIGLSGHSDVLTEFLGGDGQIAIHGDNDPSDMGKDVSHGCVRLTNDAIMKLASLPLGTPVSIS
jgi:lipoprotein-anchoring transpeptidase ErfK/SrfK